MFTAAIALARLEDQASRAIQSIESLDDNERGELFRIVRDNLPASFSERELTDEQIKGFIGIINTGLFEEVDINTIGIVAGLSCGAMIQGADPSVMEDVALMGFSMDMSEIQMLRSAQALKAMIDAEIPPDIYQQAVSYAVYNQWNPEYITGLAQGVIRGKNEGIPLDKLTLAMIIRVDQGLGNTSFQQAVTEEIGYIRNLATADPDRARQDSIFESMRQAETQGLPSDIAREFYYNAVEEGWSAEDADKLFKGLSDGVKMGLTPERLTLAFIIRMEMDYKKVPIDQIISEETAYVADIEKQTVTLRKKDSENRPEIPESYESAPRTSINVALMQQSVNSFLGVPYQWGGTTRNGTDCSGFTQTVYREQGVIIPRVSRQQYKIGTAVNYNGLTYGDLVFFNKSGFGRITHVGLYVGDGQFAQASCSKGVTVSRLGKSYYTKRYVGAKRVVG